MASPPDAARWQGNPKPTGSPDAETSHTVLGSPAAAGARVAIAGVVTAGGRPLAGAFVMAHGPKEGPGQVATTDAQGRYRLDGLPSGPVELMVMPCDPRVSDDDPLEPAEPVVLRAGEERTLSIDLPGGAFLVKVPHGETGEPVLGAAAFARPEKSEPDSRLVPGWTWKPGAATFAGDDGTVVVTPLPPNVPHQVGAVAKGRGEATAAGLVPGTRDAPAEVVLRLTRKR